jgi:hypothetical protein
VDARGVRVSGKGKGEWDGDWEESGERRVDGEGEGGRRWDWEKTGRCVVLLRLILQCNYVFMLFICIGSNIIVRTSLHILVFAQYIHIFLWKGYHAYFTFSTAVT